METNEILNRLEEIMKNDDLKGKAKEKFSEIQAEETSSKNVIYLVLHFIINLLKTPLTLISKYFNKKFMHVLIKDAKIIGFLFAVMVVLFVFLTIMWLSISVWVGAYFYDHGTSLSLSIAYSVFFQFGSFVLVALMAFFATKKIKSLKLVKKPRLKCECKF